MTWGIMLEYVKTVRGRYLRGTKKEKGKILGEWSFLSRQHRWPRLMRPSSRLLNDDQGHHPGLR